MLIRRVISFRKFCGLLLFVFLGIANLPQPAASLSKLPSGNASATNAEIAGAKGVPANKITAKDVANMQKALKADFELADQHWKKWKPVP